MTSYDLAQIYTEIELYIIKSLKRTFYHHKNEEFKEGFQWEQWQLTKLRSMQKFRKDNIKLLGEHSNAIELAILEELNSNYKAGYDGVEHSMRKANELNPKIVLPENIKPPPIDKAPSESGLTPISDILSNVTPGKTSGNLPIVPENNNFFGMNDKKLKALVDSVNNDLKVAESSLLRQADDVYRQTIFKTHLYLQSGATTLNQAVDMATKDFLEKGFNCVVYKNGARVNIASYAEMALRTASQRATFMGEGKKRDEWNLHLVVVSAHANTCKFCLPWQGKVLIDDVYSNGSKADGDYPLLSEAMKENFLHPNCRHSLATYFPGITELPEAVDNDKALKNYEAEQKQRHMERQIRRWKRISAGEVDKSNEMSSSSKVKEWQGKLRQHLADNPHLRRDYEREKLRVKSILDKNSEGLYDLKGINTNDGIKIVNPTKHLIERAAERGVNKENIQDALKNPLKIGNIRVDSEGRRSKTYIGEKATIAINPDNGNIVTAYKTSSQRVRRLKGENKTE
jgi:hypothetical protein